MGIEKLEPSTNRLFIAHYLLRIQQNPSRRYACFVTSPKGKKGEMDQQAWPGVEK
jgi:hypothetical protein